MSCALLKPEKDEIIINGYPRVMRADVAELKGEFEPGQIVDVLDSKGNFIAKGYANPYSRIFVRVLSYDPAEKIDAEFFFKCLQKAKEFRDKITERSDPPEKSCRAVYSESDFLPGLIVDRFEDHLVIQILTYGFEVRREILIDSLAEIFKPKSIFEKSDASIREQEQLKLRSEPVYGNPPEVIPFKQHGLTFLADVTQGQKTGFFLDQRDNRAAFAKYISAGQKVLDCFCYTGSFSIYAASKGAEVIGIDSSRRALELAKKTAELNNLEKLCDFQEAKVFEKLRELEESEQVFDAIVLDPPAFAKHKGAVRNALRGYWTINMRAFKLLKPGGILVSCSCSQQVDEGSFLEAIRAAAYEAQRKIRFLEVRGQSWDHPILADLPETRYLKCAIVQAY
jgi:23S rRNA (cytosine1962-C5)-methyltransferase